MKRIILFVLIPFLLIGIGGTTYAQKVGTSSLQFLKVMPTARATGMGDAFTSLASGSEAAFWNPAGLTGTTKHELGTTLTLWLFDTKQSAISYAINLNELGMWGIDWGWLGFQFQYVDFGELEETRVDYLMFVGSGEDRRYNPGLTGMTFSPASYLLGLSYAQQLTDRFSTGITAKYIYESLWNSKQVTIINSNGEEETYNTYASLFLFDFGMLYNTGFRSILLGVSVQNFGPQVKFAKEAYPAPLNFRVGASANIIGSDALLFPIEKNRLTLAYDIFHPNDYAQQMHVGLEYSFSELLFLRTGYKWNYDNEKLTFGGGIQYGIDGYDLSFDYSYGSMGELLGQVHRLSLGVKIK
jgi:hypothetical protein